MQIIPKLRGGQRRRFKRRYQGERNALVKTRLLVILRLNDGESSVSIERGGVCVRSTVSHVAERYRTLGELGLEDGRRFNGQSKVTEEVVIHLAGLIRQSPRQFGWSRPTWTRELLAAQLEWDTGVRLGRATLTRWLRQMGARWNRPRLYVECPWSARRRLKRLREITAAVDGAGPREVVLYQDEVDIHFNPKVGPDWMMCGEQKWVRTPGKNEKRYIAGALNRQSGQLIWVSGTRKNSDLFIAHIEELSRRYRGCRRIHLILDNYSIHHSRKTRKALERYGERFVLHFLPPFCPEENYIERLWQDLHANVTRNHSCETIDELMEEVDSYLEAAPPYPGSKPALRLAA